jgi:hypothetical protein
MGSDQFFLQLHNAHEPRVSPADCKSALRGGSWAAPLPACGLCVWRVASRCIPARKVQNCGFCNMFVLWYTETSYLEASTVFRPSMMPMNAGAPASLPARESHLVRHLPAGMPALPEEAGSWEAATGFRPCIMAMNPVFRLRTASPRSEGGSWEAATVLGPCIMAMNLMFRAADGTSAVRGEVHGKFPVPA